MKEKNYFSVFAKMPLEAKIFTLQRALDIHPDKAREFIERLENELKRQETLLTLVQRKAHLSEQELIELDEIKKIRMFKQNKKEGKKERKIRLEYYYLIKKLRSEGFGWRRIAEYLRKYHRFQISHNGLKKAYLKAQKILEQEQEQ